MKQRTLEAFVAVAEELSFSRAAERLRIAQPSLSRVIVGLEQELGARLFVRTSRHVTLTNEGKAFVADAQSALFHMRRGIRSVRGLASGKHSSLTIGCNDFAMEGMLPRILREFGKRFPDVALERRELASEQQGEAILDGDIDLGFALPWPAAADVQRLLIARELFVVVLPKRHPLAARRAVELRDLACEPLVLANWDAARAYRTIVKNMFAEAGFEPIISEETTFLAELLGLVAAGAGSTLYPSCFRNHFGRNVSVRALTGTSCRVDMQLLWRNPASPLVKEFIELAHDLSSDETKGAQDAG